MSGFKVYTRHNQIVFLLCALGAIFRAVKTCCRSTITLHTCYVSASHHSAGVFQHSSCTFTNPSRLQKVLQVGRTLSDVPCLAQHRHEGNAPFGAGAFDTRYLPGFCSLDFKYLSQWQRHRCLQSVHELCSDLRMAVLCLFREAEKLELLEGESRNTNVLLLDDDGGDVGDGHISLFSVSHSFRTCPLSLYCVLSALHAALYLCAAQHREHSSSWCDVTLDRHASSWRLNFGGLLLACL